jgi:hypothetical protein
LKRAWKAVLAGLFVAAIAMPAFADSLPSQGFDNFAQGTPLVPIEDWAYTGGTAYDIGVVDLGVTGDNVTGKAARISNATMSGSFGDWLFSPPLGTPATENGSQKFSTTFDIASATHAPQAGMKMNVAPQTSGGARMTNLSFVDQGDGIHVMFSDVLNLAQVVGYYPPQESWREIDIATLSYAGSHRVRIVMNLFPGPHNDRVQVYIDGSAGLVPGRPTGEATFDGFYAPVDNQPTINKAKAGQTIPLKWRLAASSFATSWEDYYRYNTESVTAIDPQFTSRKVDSLIFQARCDKSDPLQTCKNENLGTVDDTDGYLIDNVTYESAALGTPLPVTSVGVGDANVYNTPAVRYTIEDCNTLDDLNTDAIETYTSNTGGLMYHGNGVWQYNWQTPKTLAGKCTRVYLSPTSLGGETDFTFVK